jgi:DNA N-6-adenine-methyltransferase (Dam)
MRILKPENHWATPTWLYDKLQEHYGFETSFDPCPLGCDLRKFNGLKVPWPEVTFCNPPYDKAGKSAFVHKAYRESLLGKCAVLLLPVSTSTTLFHDLIKPYAHSIEFLKGRVPFEGINSKGQWVNPWEAHISAGTREIFGMLSISNLEQVSSKGAHDSMIVVFDTRSML